MKPDWSELHNNLAWLLVTVEDKNLREPAVAIRLAKRACELTQYSHPDSLDTLSVAYAATGDFPKAIEIAEKALKLAKFYGQIKLVEEIQIRLLLYKAGKPYTESLENISLN